MSLNIIVKGSSRTMGSEEMAEHIAKKNQANEAREKAGYMDRQLKAREQMEKEDKKDGLLRPVACYDAKTYFRHEQQNPGCMNDPEYKRQYLRDNPEAKM